FALLNRLMLWPPAVLSALWLALLAPFVSGLRALGTLAWAVRGARLHPLALDGWLLGAWSAALGMRLGGPRCYDGRLFDVPEIGTGRAFAEAIDLDRAVALYIALCMALAVAAGLVLSYPMLARGLL
ncbi:MAG: cobalamin biosynthesis protein, partial [Alphaproteobacteria bacterium]